MIDPNAILDGISELFIATDREWRVTYLNRRARQYLHALGVDGDRVVGQILWEALPFLQGTPFHTAALRALASDESAYMSGSTIQATDGGNAARTSIIFPTDIGQSDDITAGSIPEELRSQIQR